VSRDLPPLGREVERTRTAADAVLQYLFYPGRQLAQRVQRLQPGFTHRGLRPAGIGGSDKVTQEVVEQVRAVLEDESRER
jgi:hypothetical protein